MTDRIKICGIFRQEDVIYVNEAKPDYIGFVFANSKRQVTKEMAADLRKQLDKDIKVVGVFVNESLEVVADIANSGIIDMIQLHGQENETYICNIKKITKKPVIKAISVTDAKDIIEAQESNADYLLFDQGKGGTGIPFDWSMIVESKKPFFLAGGICMENVDKALEYGAFAIDVSGGVETDGIKDKEKIKQMVERIRRCQKEDLEFMEDSIYQKH